MLDFDHIDIFFWKFNHLHTFPPPFALPIDAWWRHQMETFSALLAICAGNSLFTGELPAQRPVTQSFDVFFDLRLNKRLSKQWWGWWFEVHRYHVWWRPYLLFPRIISQIEAWIIWLSFVDDSFGINFGAHTLGFIFQIHWKLSRATQLTIIQQWLNDGYAPSKKRFIIWTNDGPVYWLISASLNLDELIIMCFRKLELSQKLLLLLYPPPALPSFWNRQHLWHCYRHQCYN